MADCNEKNVQDMLEFLFAAPCDEEMIALDCNDVCQEKLARLAEQVAAGGNLEELYPKWAEHIRYWVDCREEFDALVAVLKAEGDGKLAAALDRIAGEVASQRTKKPPISDQ